VDSWLAKKLYNGLMIKNQKILDSSEVIDKTIKLSCDTGAGHLAPSLSTVNILTVLFRDFLMFDVNNPRSETRDRFILSKGHGCYAYYVILNMLGFIPQKELDVFNTAESSLFGCVCANEDYMLEASTGSLGHGLPIAVGMAWAFKMKNMPNRVVCMVGDGEMQEGSNFESLQFASRYKLDNLLVIVDGNGLQGCDYVEDVALSNDKLLELLSVYTSENRAIRADGHDEMAIASALANFFSHQVRGEGVMAILFDTIKGYGLPIAEGKKNYHFRCPTQDGYSYKQVE